MEAVEKPILSDLAWKILRRLNEGSMTGSQLESEFMLNAAAMQELIEAGFITQKRMVS